VHLVSSEDEAGAIFPGLKKIGTYLLLIFLFAGVAASAQKNKNQSREQLENQRLLILEEIKRTQEQLTLLRKDKKASLSELQALQTKLSARQQLIQNINKEISIIEENINLTNRDVMVLKTQLDTLKKQYAEMVRYTYKNRTSSDMIVFLFSAASFNDAIRRLQYVKQYRNYRADQAIKITSASKQLSNKITVLNIQKQKKDFVLTAQQQQTKILEAETAEKDKIVTQLKGKEKELIAGLAQKKKAADDLNRAISAAIRKEIELARKRALEEKMREQRALKAKQEQEKKLAAQKKAEQYALGLKLKQEEEARKLEEARKKQAEKEKQALLEKQKREENERKLAQEKKEREQRERQLEADRKARLENERKASKLAEAQRIEKEKQLAVEKQKQEERERQLVQEKQKQEERQQQLLAQKQRQEEEQRNLVEEKKRQDREQARLASKTPFNNPRYVPTLAEKQKQEEEAKALAMRIAEEEKAPPTKSFTSDDYKYSLTPEERQLTNSFEANKGRLPWPVEKGYITERFGKNKHPLFNITTENYGIDIKTSRGAGARTIFAGEVNSVINIPGMGQTVLINHGTFYTVYAKLAKVNVAKGTKVSMKQSIGTVSTDDEGNTQIHFEIWKVGANGQPFKVNPEQWVAQ
jgi:septal ring factor EnvC (AmiA/AmiB activator)